MKIHKPNLYHSTILKVGSLGASTVRIFQNLFLRKNEQKNNEEKIQVIAKSRVMGEATFGLPPEKPISRIRKRLKFARLKNKQKPDKGKVLVKKNGIYRYE